MFGISPQRLTLYALAVIGLIALNAVRYLGDQVPETATPGTVGSAPLALPELVFLPAGDGLSTPARDLFQRREEAPPPPPPVVAPPPPTPQPAAPDPRATALAAANRRLDRVTVVGIFSSADGMIAVLDAAGDVDNVQAGDSLFPGFVVTDVSISGIVVENSEIGLKRTLNLGDAGAN